MPHSHHTILILEDEFLNRRHIKKVFEGEGFTVVEASRAAEALEILASRKIDLAVLDIHLDYTQEDGISVGSKIKAQYQIPFIYLTAFETPEIISQALQTKPSSYITKPFSNTDLIVSAEIALQQHVKHAATEQTILVKDEDFYVDLLIDNIDFAETDGNYLKIVASGHMYSYRSSIKSFLEMMPPNIFLQTHRAFVVHAKKIVKFNAKSLFIQGTEIPISKRFYEAVRKTVSEM